MHAWYSGTIHDMAYIDPPIYGPRTHAEACGLKGNQEKGKYTGNTDNHSMCHTLTLLDQWPSPASDSRKALSIVSRYLQAGHISTYATTAFCTL